VCRWRSPTGSYVGALKKCGAYQIGVEEAMRSGLTTRRRNSGGYTNRIDDDRAVRYGSGSDGAGSVAPKRSQTSSWRRDDREGVEIWWRRHPMRLKTLATVENKLEVGLWGLRRPI
jgi:hypothetical protein